MVGADGGPEYEVQELLKFKMRWGLPICAKCMINSFPHSFSLFHDKSTFSPYAKRRGAIHDVP